MNKFVWVEWKLTWLYGFDLQLVEPLLLVTSNPFRELKIWSWKNVQIIFLSVTSIEGTPQFRGREHFFWVPKHGFNLRLGDYTPEGGGGVLPYMGDIGMCRCEGYKFQAVYSRIGYINQSVWVQSRVSFLRKLISCLKIFSIIGKQLL